MADSLRGEIRDQLAHMIAAAAAVAPVIICPSIWTFALLGFQIGLIREVTELGTPVTPAKAFYAAATSKLDLLFWAAGAALISFSLGV